MADATPKATYGILYPIANPGDIREGDIITRILSVGGNTAKACHVMSAEGEADGYCDIAATGDLSVLGICLGPVTPADTYDIDDVITDGETVKILRPTGGRIQVYVYAEGAGGTTAATEGEPVSIGGTNAGMVRLWEYASGTTTHNHSTLGAATWVQSSEFVGTSAHKWTEATNDDIVIMINF